MFSKTLFIIVTTIIAMKSTCTPLNRVITTLKYSRFSVRPTVVSGRAMPISQVPYLVSIKEPYRKSNESELLFVNLCGGSIITASTVLTAAHCFEADKFYLAKHPETLRAVAGSHRTDVYYTDDINKTDPEVQWRMIKEVVIHKHFNFPENDIALLYLNADWVYSKTINFIQRATKNVDNSKPCITAGFGKVDHIDENKTSQILLLAPIAVISRFMCSALWELPMDSFICTSSAFSEVSEGDSGGPLVCRNSLDPAEKRGRQILVGVVSGKSYDKTTLFTRVSAYRRWIDRNNRASTLKRDITITLLCFGAISLMLLFF